MSVRFDLNHPMRDDEVICACGHGPQWHMPEQQKDGGWIYGECTNPECADLAEGCQQMDLNGDGDGR